MSDIDYEPRKIAWSKIDWMNTHFEGLDHRDVHHIGRTSSEVDGDLVVLRIGSDDDTKQSTTIMLSSDQAHDLAAALRMAAR